MPVNYYSVIGDATPTSEQRMSGRRILGLTSQGWRWKILANGHRGVGFLGAPTKTGHAQPGAKWKRNSRATKENMRQCRISE